MPLTLTLSPEGRGPDEGNNHIEIYETDCIAIFKPLIITPLTNTPLFVFQAIQQILSKVKQAVN